MARDRLPAEEIVDELIAVAVAPTLEAAGFRRIGRDFHRRHGEAVQVVDVLESVQTARYRECCIYVGIAFDPMCRLAGLPVLERPVILRPGGIRSRIPGDLRPAGVAVPGRPGLVERPRPAGLRGGHREGRRESPPRDHPAGGRARPD
jgi:hypothetical protein